MKGEKHSLCVVLNTVISLISCIKAKSAAEYVCHAHPGPADYTQHDLYSDGIRIQNSSFVTFQVKCEGHAYILLHQDRHVYTNHVAEIGLGVSDNKAVSISDKQTKQYTWCRVPDILSDSEYRFFWITWNNDIIRVGSGHRPHTHEFKCKEGISFYINYISIGTAYNTTAYWKFYLVSPQSTRLPTTEGDNRPSQSTSPTNDEEVNGRTAIHISVPVTIVIAMLISAIIVLIYRKQRTSRGKKTEPEVVYHGNVVAVANELVVLGVENPTYNTLTVETHGNAHGASGNASESDSAHYAEIKGILPPDNNVKQYEDIDVNSRDITKDEHTYDHLSKEDLAKSPNVHAETFKTTYCNITPAETVENTNTKNGCYDYETKNEIETNAKMKEPIEDHEGQSSLYDHVATGGHEVRRVDTSGYSHLNEFTDN